MSEKSTLQAAATAANTNQPPTHSSKTRIYKALCFFLCNLYAGHLHKATFPRAQLVHQARWDELLVPHDEDLAAWIKLFMATSKSSNSRWSFMDSPAAAVAAGVCFVLYVSLYANFNRRSDRIQLHVLGTVAAFGFMVALALGLGAWIAAFCVVPRAVLLGLLGSDVGHLVLRSTEERMDGGVGLEDTVSEKA